MRHVVIVGAGPGGLATAMLLAAAGARVTILERQPRLGGRSGTIEADGFRFDIGPTFFLYPRPLQDIFRACGRRLEECVDLLRLDPQYHLRFEDGQEIHATSQLERMQAEIRRFAPADAEALPQFMADNRRKLAAFRPVLERPFTSLSAFLDPAVIKALALLRPTRSVDSDLTRHFKDSRVRLAFSFQSKYLGMSPFQCPSLFTILSFLEYEYGVFHPRGGCGAVMQAMATAAGEMGVEIRLADPVQEILFKGRRALGVRTEAGTELRADALVLNADFAHAMTTLVPDRLRRRWTDRRLAGKKFSCSTFMMYLGVDGRFPDLAHHTIWLAQDYGRNIAEIQTGRSLPINPSFYVQNACTTDPGQAPDGCSALYVLVPVAHRTPDIDWAAHRAEFRALIFRQLVRIGLPADLERRIRFERIVTPVDWEQDMAIYRGATFNLAHSMGQMLHLRPRNQFEDLDGVYLVGGGTHPGSGLPVIFESARITARLMSENLGLGQPRMAAE